MTRDNMRVAWLLAGLAFAVVAVVYLLGLSAPLNNSDEAIYAEFIRAMHRSGDYLTLRYQGVELLQRPPTAVSLYAITAVLIPGEYGLRFMPALCTLLSCVGAGVVVWRLSGRLFAGVVALFIAAGIPDMYFYGRLMFSDPPFVLACSGALVATLAAQADPRWLPWAGAGLGVGFAIKSLAAGIPAVALAPWLVRAVWVHREAARIKLRVALAAVSFVALAAPYYVYHLIVHGQRFYDEHIGRIVLDRASGDLESVVGMGGPLAYLDHIGSVQGPLVAVLIAAVLLVGATVAIRQRDARLGVVVSYAVACLVLLSLVGTRLAHYLLIIYPAVAVAAGLLVARTVGLDRAPITHTPLWRVSACLLGFSLFATTIARPPLDPLMAPAPETKVLGEHSRDTIPDGQPIYTYNWYAPAIGVYADRPWRLLSSQPAVTRALQNTDPFRYTGNIDALPPWPDGQFVLGGRFDELYAAPGLTVVQRLGQYNQWTLVVAEARSGSGQRTP